MTRWHAALLGLALVRPLSAQDPYAMPAPRYQYTLEKDVMVPMRDGVRLATNLYRPIGAGERLPVILMRTPYGKNTYAGATAPAEFFAKQGYLVAVQDVRGKYDSEGEYEVETPDRDDGYDTVDWLAKQPWSTGRIGSYGCSYLGEVQYLLSAARHPNHLAMIPQAASGATGPAGGYYTDFGAYEGGAFLLSTAFGWFGYAGSRVKDQKTLKDAVDGLGKLDFAALLRTLPTATMDRRAGFLPSEYEDFLRHPPADAWWARKRYLRDDDRFDTPSLQVNSWLDVTPEQTLYVFNLMQRNAVTPRTRNNQYVVMSPTTHCASESAKEHTLVGNMDVGDARYAYWKLYLDWFDHWLRGMETGVTRRPKVTYFVMHEGWRTAPTWPVPGMKVEPWYLESGGNANTSAGDGRLTPAKPAADAADRYVYDPADPFPSRGGTVCCTGNPKDVPGIFEQTDLESRRDLLVYTSPVLDQGLTIAGTVKLDLYVSTDVKDTDFNAKLLDVDPQGRSWNVMNGVLRGRYREGIDRTVWMEKDRVYRVTVSLKATAYRFLPGHRLRLHVTSSDFPLYDRNLNTGGPNFDETSWLKASVSVHHGPATPSALLLPVVP